MPNYKDYKKLIHRICHSWHKTTGIDLQTLESEANVAFAECLHNYNQEKGKFSTLLWCTTESRFKNLLKRSHQNRYDGIEVELEDIATYIPGNQEANCIFKNAINNLSKEGKEIVSVVLDAPADLIAMIPKPKLFSSKHQLTKYFRLKGWKFSTITKAFTEIKKELDF